MTHTRKELRNCILLIYQNISAPSGSEDELIDAVFKFEELSQHPAGSDLIFWSKPDADKTPEGIIAEVERWRQQNGLPALIEE